MTELHHALQTLNRLLRPKLLGLARRRKLMRKVFNEFVRQCYPGAPPHQIEALRNAFVAGALEMWNVQIYASDMGTDDATDEDLEFIGNVTEELTDAYERIIATAAATGAPPKGDMN